MNMMLERWKHTGKGDVEKKKQGFADPIHEVEKG